MSEGIRREVFRLAVPIVLSSLLQRSVGIIDTLLVGRLGAQPLAALGIGHLLIFFLLTPIWGLSIGASAAVAQLWGAGRRGEAGWTAAQVTFAGISLAIPLGLLGIFISRPLALLLGAEPEVASLVKGYAQIVGLAFAFTALIYILSSILHGTGDTRSPLYAMAVANLLHLFLAYLLIYGRLGLPRLGLQGAALAVAFSSGMGVLLLFLKAKRARYLTRPLLDPSYLFRVVRLGLPVALDRLILHGGMILYARMVLRYGTAAYAAHQVGLQVEAFSFIPGLALGTAASILVGQSIGAGDIPKARASNREANRLGILFMGGMGLLFLTFPGFFLKLFTREAEVIRLGTVYMRIAGVSQVPLAFTMILSGSLRGAGDTRFIMAVTFVGIWLVRLPLSSLASFLLDLGVAFVWWAFLLDWSVRTALLLRRFRSRRWERPKV